MLASLIRRYVCYRTGHNPSAIQVPDSRGRVICLRCFRPCKPKLRNGGLIPRHTRNDDMVDAMSMAYVNLVDRKRVSCDGFDPECHIVDHNCIKPIANTNEY